MQQQMYMSQPQIGNDDREQIEIYISCRSLANKDTFSKSDPYVIMKIPGKAPNTWVESARTETIQDNLNPNFVKSFIYDYIFEIQQHVKFEVWDYDSPTSSDFIGEAQTTIGKIVGSKNQTLILDLKDNKQKYGGKIILRADKINQCNDSIYMGIQVKNIVNSRWFSKGNPFLRFIRTTENQFNVQVHETEVVKSTVNPVFKPFEIKIQKICNGNLDQPVQIQLWDHHESGKHELVRFTCLLLADSSQSALALQATRNPPPPSPIIGSAAQVSYKLISLVTFWSQLGSTMVSVNQLVQQKANNLQFKENKTNKVVGVMVISQTQVIEKPLFIDFLKGGLQLNLVIAVDFTGNMFARPCAPGMGLCLFLAGAVSNLRPWHRKSAFTPAQKSEI